MTCEPALISAYLDGALSPSRRRQIESHMRICPACRGMHRDYMALRRGMDSLPWQQAPERLHGGIRAQIAAHQMRGGRRSRRWVPLSSAAAVAVVALSAASAPAWLFSGSPLPAARPVVTFSLPMSQPAAIPSDSVIELRFGASVDRDAVQQALAVSPPVAAHMEWQQEKLRIVPEPKLDPDTTYTISVASQAAGAVPGPFSLQVRTAPQENAERPRPATEGSANSAAMVQAAPNATPPAGDAPAYARPAAAAMTLASDTMQPGACTYTVASALARLTRERPEQAARLGCATTAEVQTPFHEQTFEAGMLLRREDAGRVYLLQAQPRRWRAVNEEAPAGKDAARSHEPQAGADWSGVALGSQRIATVTPTAAASLPTEPSAVFLSVWRMNPELRTVIGGPAGRSRRGAAVIQEFEQGIVLVNDRGGLYALSRDATWTYLAEQLDVARAPRTAAP